MADMGEAQRKIAELQQQLGGKELTQENVQQLEMQKQQEEQMKDEMLSQICSPEALDRLRRVGLVKPDVARRVRESLLQAARSGQVKAMIEEGQVKDMLERVSSTATQASKITIQRKTYFDEDSDDNDDDLL